MEIAKLKEKFISLYGVEPKIIRSPGRINIIGEHTDYNDGFVFPAAIDKEIVFAMAENQLDKFRFFAIDLNESFELDVRNLSKSSCNWANYLLGVLAQFKTKGHKIQGVDCVFSSTIPVGAGLSSSAALENGFAFGLNEIFEFDESPMNLVKIAQKAEHEYAGVQCGIMDQFASMFGKEHKAIKLDCRSLEYEYADIDLRNYRFVLCNTKVSHSLASSEYNLRRQECEKGVGLLKKYDKTINSLRDVSSTFLEKYKHEFDEIIYNRCEFVITENERVLSAFDALKRGDIAHLGRLMYESHRGLSEKYQVSCLELDFLVTQASENPAVLGARMMGGGFGGCTINLVRYEQVEAFSEHIATDYELKFNRKPEIYVVKIADGVSKVVKEK